ncbi:hypothetical protein BKA80DRAFT_311657 [Phyllosticta citrichinensis]
MEDGEELSPVMVDLSKTTTSQNNTKAQPTVPKAPALDHAQAQPAVSEAPTPQAENQARSRSPKQLDQGRTPPTGLKSTASQAPEAEVPSGTSSQVMYPTSSNTIGKQDAATQTMPEGAHLQEGPEIQREKRKHEEEEDGISSTVSKKAKE